MLDREFSALIGAPSSIRDEDITVKLPAEMDNSVEHINLTLHVRLSRLMATILTSKTLSFPFWGQTNTDNNIAVYGVDNDFDDTLVRSTQSILHSMAELSQDLTDFLDTHFHGLISRASKMAIRLMLAHHHVSESRQSRNTNRLTQAVRGFDDKATGHVRSSYAHWANRATNFSNNCSI